MSVTVEQLLTGAVDRLRASGSESARLDGELLLGMAIGADRTTLRAHPQALVGAAAASAFEAALVRREAGEPVAYIRGLKEFHGLAFGVDARALIPRPETETLVELAQAEVMRRLSAAPRGADTGPLAVADVGTGSGAIAIALVAALRRRRADADVAVLATDRSADALDLARENAVAHGVADRIRFAQVDLLPDDTEPFDLVLANLPYVRTDAMDGLPVATSFEPREALDGGGDGLAIIRALLDRLPEALKPAGAALLEIGGDQGKAIMDVVAEHLPGWACSVAPDLGGLPRVARVERGAPDDATTDAGPRPS